MVNPRGAKVGPWSGSSVTWERVRNADSRPQPGPTWEEAFHKIPRGFLRASKFEKPCRELQNC